MSNMRKFVREYNGQQITELRFPVKLLSISEQALTNVNGKKYFPCSIEFVDASGVIQKTSAMMYEGNQIKGVRVGESYMASAVKTERGILVRVSHLSPIIADRPEESMFDFDIEDSTTSATVIEDNVLEFTGGNPKS